MVKILRRRSSVRGRIHTIHAPPLHGWRQLRHKDKPIYPPAGSDVEDCLRARAASTYLKINLLCVVSRNKYK